MVELTNMNGVTFVLNSSLIETIELIPETKVTTTTRKYLLDREKPEEIVQKLIAYNQKIFQNDIRTS